MYEATKTVERELMQSSSGSGEYSNAITIFGLNCLFKALVSVGIKTCAIVNTRCVFAIVKLVLIK